MTKHRAGGLTPKEEKFCRLYASDDYFCNGVRAYLEAFKKKGKPIGYASARARASMLLTNVNILARINQLIDLVINDVTVDKELGKVITQDADFRSKVQAIKEYNRVKKRVADPGFSVAVLLESEHKKALDELLDHNDEDNEDIKESARDDE